MPTFLRGLVFTDDGQDIAEYAVINSPDRIKYKHSLFQRCQRCSVSRPGPQFHPFCCASHYGKCFRSAPDVSLTALTPEI
jgi:hypothetical protein